ncbi:hypothetical protein NW759_017605 [Fusarium solani]|nr:hypothetical protein NW759_017605 [Fusarium solani]
MQFTVPAIFAFMLAMSQFVAAAPQRIGDDFRDDPRLSPAAVAALDAGCPNNFVNFVTGDCDDPSFK